MSTSSQNPEPTTHVVMHGSTPLAAASTLEAAKADATARETRYDRDAEYHWTESQPGEWRLMARPEVRKRFSWTQYWVLTVPTVEATGGAR